MLFSKRERAKGHYGLLIDDGENVDSETEWGHVSNRLISERPEDQEVCAFGYIQTRGQVWAVLGRRSVILVRVKGGLGYGGWDCRVELTSLYSDLRPDS